MSDVERYIEPSPLVVRDHQAEAVNRLTEWAQSAQAASQVAHELVRTSFVPDSFRGKPHEATAAILAGLELGLQPMAALRSFDVIGGAAAPRAITLRAILQSRGHEIELVESTGTRCKMRGRRQGAQAWQEVVWTLDRAKQLKLAGKPNWQNQPQAMLVARATSELARLIASDAILGVAYSSEELADGAGAGVEVPAITASEPADDATAGTKRMSRRKAPAAIEAPEPEPEPADPDAVTDAQIKKMIVSFKASGISDRKDRIDYMSAVIGREVDSSKDLTKGEASMVIDALEVLEHDVIDAASDELPLDTGDDQ